MIFLHPGLMATRSNSATIPQAQTNSPQKNTVNDIAPYVLGGTLSTVIPTGAMFMKSKQTDAYENTPLTIKGKGVQLDINLDKNTFHTGADYNEHSQLERFRFALANYAQKDATSQNSVHVQEEYNHAGKLEKLTFSPYTESNETSVKHPLSVSPNDEKITLLHMDDHWQLPYIDSIEDSGFTARQQETLKKITTPQTLHLTHEGASVEKQVFCLPPIAKNRDARNALIKLEPNAVIKNASHRGRTVGLTALITGALSVLGFGALYNFNHAKSLNSTKH